MYAPGNFLGLHSTLTEVDTVMYVLQGESSYEDAKGPKGTLKKDDVQWIVSGSGIEHIEGTDHPGGILHAFQLWVNCKASKKMADPSYQDVPGKIFRMYISKAWMARYWQGCVTKQLVLFKPRLLCNI